MTSSSILSMKATSLGKIIPREKTTRVLPYTKTSGQPSIVLHQFSQDEIGDIDGLIDHANGEIIILEDQIQELRGDIMETLNVLDHYIKCDISYRDGFFMLIDAIDKYGNDVDIRIKKLIESRGIKTLVENGRG